MYELFLILSEAKRLLNLQLCLYFKLFCEQLFDLKESSEGFWSKTF